MSDTDLTTVDGLRRVVLHQRTQYSEAFTKVSDLCRLCGQPDLAMIVVKIRDQYGLGTGVVPETAAPLLTTSQIQAALLAHLTAHASASKMDMRVSIIGRVTEGDLDYALKALITEGAIQPIGYGGGRRYALATRAGSRTTPK